MSSLVTEMNRQVAGLRKEAQLASMEQVTRLRDEMANERRSVQRELSELRDRVNMWKGKCSRITTLLVKRYYEIVKLKSALVAATTHSQWQADELNRRKEAQMASMEQVTRLRDRLDHLLKELENERIGHAANRVRYASFQRGLRKRVTELEQETHRWREAYNEMKQHLEDEKREAIRRLNAEHEKQVRTRAETKAECRERYINGGLPADVNEWMRNCDVQKAPSLDIRGPSC